MQFKSVRPFAEREVTVLFADDSSVARRQIQRTLEIMRVKYISAPNGRAAWDELNRLAGFAEAQGCPVTDLVSAVLTDIEMPEMDGFILTKMIKNDPRLADLPVIMHSSLSGTSNQMLGRGVGVDAYVSKFVPQQLAETLERLLKVRAPEPAAA